MEDHGGEPERTQLAWRAKNQPPPARAKKVPAHWSKWNLTACTRIVDANKQNEKFPSRGPRNFYNFQRFYW